MGINGRNSHRQIKGVKLLPCKNNNNLKYFNNFYNKLCPTIKHKSRIIYHINSVNTIFDYMFCWIKLRCGQLLYLA